MSKGLSRAEAQSIALEFVESMNYQIPLDYKIRDTWKQIYGFDSVCGGAFHSAEKPGERGFVTLAANNHRSKAAVQRTLQHEILGHYMLYTYTPTDKREVIERIMASQSEPSLVDQWHKVKHHYPDKPLSIQAEELFASIAERVDITKAPDTNSDQLLDGIKDITLGSIESTVQYRLNLMRNGQLEQKTFPDTDVHSGIFIAANLERRLGEWRADHGVDKAHSPTKPLGPRI